MPSTEYICICLITAKEKSKSIQDLLGSKDLGTNVFRTLICNVGKP